MRSQQAEWAIMQIRFRYLIEDRDRHGNIRVYVRVTGEKGAHSSAVRDG